MGHATPRAQLRLREHRVQQFIRMKAALHEDFHLARRGHFRSHVGGGVAVGNVDQFTSADVEPRLLSRPDDLGLRSDQHRNNQSVTRGIQRAAERLLIAGMHDRAAHRFKSRAFGEQRVKAHLRIEKLDMRRDGARTPDFLRRRNHARNAADDLVAMLVHHQTIQRQPLLGVILGADGHRHSQCVANADGAREMQVLIDIDRAGPWKDGAQQRGDQSAAPHAMGDHAMEHRVVGVVSIEMRGVGVARNCGEGLNVRNGQLTREARSAADLDLVIGHVLDHGDGGNLIHNTLFQAIAWQPAST